MHIYERGNSVWGRYFAQWRKMFVVFLTSLVMVSLETLLQQHSVCDVTMDERPVLRLGVQDENHRVEEVSFTAGY